MKKWFYNEIEDSTKRHMVYDGETCQAVLIAEIDPNKELFQSTAKRHGRLIAKAPELLEVLKWVADRQDATPAIKNYCMMKINAVESGE